LICSRISLIGLPSWGAVGLVQYATGALLKMAEGRKTQRRSKAGAIWQLT
jgi:hypothetical protein